MQINIDFATIVDWQSFHSQFQQKMGFPDFYSNNMNAWIDCMSSIDAPEDGMCKVTVSKNLSLNIHVSGLEAVLKTCPDVANGFLECVIHLNQRFLQAKSYTRLKLVLI
jgi:RNAse (barnase) inhibitor barstar